MRGAEPRTEQVLCPRVGGLEVGGKHVELGARLLGEKEASVQGAFGRQLVDVDALGREAGPADDKGKRVGVTGRAGRAGEGRRTRRAPP